ncbi:MAG TPA: ParB/RepB/Spo0J family partition protein, partial [Acidimicrobiales bacterium]|nr:ParB/RepB/Spo0J family partition protein [Acidimicrobiales bacterium]
MTRLPSDYGGTEMARRRPNMSDRLSGPAPDTTDNVTPITRGRDAFTAEAAPATATGSAVEVSVDLIDPSPHNPRSDLGDLKELAGSIKELGVLQPILVRPNGDRYDLIYGHRRLAATKLAERATVPVLFAGQEDEVNDHETRLVENLHREDLSPLDEARAYEQLLALGVANGQRGLAKRIQVPQTRISRRLALLQLPAEVQQELDSQRITLNDATALTKLNDDPERQARALKDAPVFGGVEKAVTRQVTAAKKEAERQAKLDELRAGGVSIIDDPMPYSRTDGPFPLTRLPWVDVDEHAKENCHAVAIPFANEITPLCVNPQAHPDPREGARSDERAQKDAERKAEEEARLRARAERQKFASSLVTKGNPADGAALAAYQCLGGGYVRADSDLVAQLLGLSPDTYNGTDAADAVSAYVAKGTR